MKPPDQSFPKKSAMAAVVERNIHALLARRMQDEQRLAWQDRLADRITRFTGSMRFVYLHVLLYGAWIALNLGWLPIKPFDPTFVILAMEASVEAIFLSTFILISQNRMTAQAAARADLDLQISLLAEHEITRLITMVTEIGNRMGIDSAKNPELNELARDVAPEQVLDTIQEQENHPA
jgi:uncharacterized membrane protein